MPASRHRFSLAMLLPLALLAACAADPAADAPAAEVHETPADTAAAPAATEAVVYELAEDSKVEWNASKVTRSHDGGFEEVEGTIRLVGGDPASSSVDVVIDTTSIYSDTERLTGHLKSEDFFAVETFPEARFTSTAIEPQADGTYLMTGDLTMHGVTKRVSFPANISVGEGSVEADAEFSIKRFDWEIAYQGAADDLIRDDVLIRFDLVAHPAGEGDPAAPAGDAMPTAPADAAQGT